MSLLAGMRATFVLYALTGVVLWLLYLRLPGPSAPTRATSAPLGPSRGIVTALIALGWAGAPLVACGVLKITYDLSLLGAFRDGRHRVI